MAAIAYKVRAYARLVGVHVLKGYSAACRGNNANTMAK